MLDLYWARGDRNSAERIVRLAERAGGAKGGADHCNDLAVFWLTVSKSHPRGELLALLTALEHAERALAKASARSDVMFNRALILERLQLLRAAERGWVLFGASEPDIAWRTEGGRSLSELRSRRRRAAIPWTKKEVAGTSTLGARAFRERTQEEVLSLLTAAEQALRQGSEEGARQSLSRAHDLSVALREVGADSTFERMVSLRQAIQALGQTDYISLTSGINLFRAGQLLPARGNLARAKRGLERSGSPAWQWAEYHLGAIDVSEAEYAAAEARYLALLKSVPRTSAILRARIMMGLGVSRVRRGSYTEAATWYATAAELLSGGIDEGLLGHALFLLAEAFSYGGVTVDADTAALSGMRLLAIQPPREAHSVLLTLVASRATSEGLKRAAAVVLNEAVEVAEAQVGGEVLAFALLQRAQHFESRGDTTASRADLVRATHVAQQVPQGPGSRRIRAVVRMISGDLLREANPRGAIALFSKAVKDFRALDSHPFLPSTIYRRSVARLRLGDTLRALRDLELAVQTLELQSSRLMGVSERTTFIETLEGVLDLLIKVNLNAGRSDAALGVLDRARAMVWFRSVKRKARASAALHASTEFVRDTGPLVAYAVLEDELVSWSIVNGRTAIVRAPIQRDSLRGKIERVRDGSSSGEVEDLYDLLIRPHASRLRAVSHLRFVPDRELALVPFAGLRDRVTGQFAIEKFAVSLAPSLAGYDARSSMVRKSPDHAVVVSDSRLRGAYAEGRSVSGLYRRSDLLEGEAATKRQIESAAASGGVLHFAGHGVSDPRRPDQSFLVLSDKGQEVRLTAAEIAEMRLSNIEVVVLSACGSLSPRGTHSGAISGLAYSFHRAGVLSSVSTLWEVNDDLTAPFAIEVHRGIVAGKSPADALRAAQLQAIRGVAPTPFLVWAAFVHTSL